jgi:hypothetical protein
MRSLIFSALLLFMPLHSFAGDVIDDTDSLSTKDSLSYFTSGVRQNVYKENGRESRYDRRIHYFRKYWATLIPTQVVAQNAGNMGIFSIGLGWDYGKHRQWETHLLWGYIPKYDSTRGKLTMTLKENYIPWSIYVGKGWSVEPFETGLYINTVYGHEFWRSQPKRYPDKYYSALSTKFRINIFFGQRVTKVIPNNHRMFVKSITAFYEISTCDLYIRSMLTDDDVKLKDILGLSLGLKFQLL